MGQHHHKPTQKIHLTENALMHESLLLPDQSRSTTKDKENDTTSFQHDLDVLMFTNKSEDMQVLRTMPNGGSETGSEGEGARGSARKTVV